MSEEVEMNSRLANRVWSREELMVAFNLYCQTPFSKIDRHLASIIELAHILGRTPSSVALKLLNFARLDPTLKERSITGLSHGNKVELDIWNEFNKNWDELAFKSEQIIAQLQGKNIEEISAINTSDLPREGKERSAIVKTRVNQQFFRRMILASYNNTCCMSGMRVPELLVASHIIPWFMDEKNRMNPHNGLCLNALHDKAFDNGLITVTPEYRIRISEKLKNPRAFCQEHFLPLKGEKIRLPHRFPPARDLLEYHNRFVFIDQI